MHWAVCSHGWHEAGRGSKAQSQTSTIQNMRIKKNEAYGKMGFVDDVRASTGPFCYRYNSRNVLNTLDMKWFLENPLKPKCYICAWRSRDTATLMPIIKSLRRDLPVLRYSSEYQICYL